MKKAKQKHFPKALVQLFRALGQPARLRILLAIGGGEACVCHLEAALDQRQAYISQQLMALRKTGLVKSRRAGRNVYYRLADTDLLDLIQHAGQIAGIPEGEVRFAPAESSLSNCCCPHCTGQEDSAPVVRLEQIQAR